MLLEHIRKQPLRTPVDGLVEVVHVLFRERVVDFGRQGGVRVVDVAVVRFIGQHPLERIDPRRVGL